MLGMNWMNMMYYYDRNEYEDLISHWIYISNQVWTLMNYKWMLWKHWKYLVQPWCQRRERPLVQAGSARVASGRPVAVRADTMCEGLSGGG